MHIVDTLNDGPLPSLPLADAPRVWERIRHDNEGALGRLDA